MDDRIDRLAALPQGQFDQLVTELRVPAGVLSPAMAPQLSRATELVKYFQQPGYDLSVLDSALARIQSDRHVDVRVTPPTPNPSPSRVTNSGSIFIILGLACLGLLCVIVFTLSTSKHNPPGTQTRSERSDASSLPAPTSAPKGNAVLSHPPMIVIPLGDGIFYMGNDRGAGGHKVILTRRFELSQTEVTQEQYKEVMKDNPAHFAMRSDWATLPVESVSWYDAIRYCNKLSETERRIPCYKIVSSDSGSEKVDWPQGLSCNGYRLPTEAEWEFAARARQPYKYAGSNQWELVGRFNGDPLNPITGFPHPVGSHDPNAWRLFDMSGNVWELVWDVYAEYKNGALEIDPIGPNHEGERVLRGGSWGSNPDIADIAYRIHVGPDVPRQAMGFRIARSLAQ